jgi:hypothetical protein
VRHGGDGADQAHQQVDLDHIPLGFPRSDRSTRALVEYDAISIPVVDEAQRDGQLREARRQVRRDIAPRWN